MRLNFTHADDDKIVEGIGRLSNVVEKWGKQMVDEATEPKKDEVITGV
jgi:hypothetical protein